jgi:hypothetical protein
MVALSVAAIVQFLSSNGIAVRQGPVPAETVVPGIFIDRGAIVFDPEAMRYPGDLLHEAGHLAVLTPQRRADVHASTGDDGGEEMAAIAWSYAAALHLGIDPAIVFHAGGYRQGSASILENFRDGRYIGVPLLEWLGLTLGARRAGELGLPPYPAMQRWVRE